ncbi:MAG: uroporphyrinogen decarboxylase family protein [Candidatus Latescibacterota bacterium]
MATPMTSRERFHATVRYADRDRLFHTEMGPYPETLRRWRTEGLPPDSDWVYYGGYDRMETAPLNPHLCPAFEFEVLATAGAYETYRDGDGVIKKRLKDIPPPAMPQYLEYPLRGREQWPGFRRRLDPSSPARVPVHWESLKRQYRQRDFPLGINAGSLFGWLRNWMGVEGLSLTLYDDRPFVEKAAEEMADSLLAYLERGLEGMDFDYAVFWEDMAYKTGSLIDPRLYRQIFAPHYRRITDRLHRAGIHALLLDSDGRVDELIPIWLDLGINYIYPMEVAAGMDVVDLRRRFGRELLIGGGMDKRVLAADREAIRRMVEEKKPLMQEGGYVPGCDHAMPPDIPWGNYRYYRDLLLGIEP